MAIAAERETTNNNNLDVEVADFLKYASMGFKPTVKPSFEKKIALQWQIILKQMKNFKNKTIITINKDCH